MCTLSWTPTAGGYWVFFNRDERVTRAPGTPPALRAGREVRILAPTDGDFGGTWIGVNEYGIGAALLNRYEDAPVDPPVGSISRGLLVLDLLDVRSISDLVRRLTTTDLAPYQPFTIAAFAPDQAVSLADWNGQRLSPSVHREPGLVRTSSGRDQREAERVRFEAFHALVPAESASNPNRLREVHASHFPERGPFSVCMHRPEAATQSLTEIRVTPRTRTIRYHPGSPCEPATVTARRLRAAESVPSR